MKFPLAILDFEASSLNLSSYPIEAGIALAASPTTSIQTWSSLIRPADDWPREDWDQGAEKVHGIAYRDLATGQSAAEVASGLNRLLGPIGHAWCDAIQYDGYWLKTLYRAAGAKPAFHLWSVSALFALDRALANRVADILAQTIPPHRAAQDAERLCRALILATQN